MLDRPGHTRPRIYYIGAMVLVLVGLVIGLGLSAGLDQSRVPAAQNTAIAASTSALAALPESPFIGVVDRALPAVVFIDVKKKVGGGSDDPQEELFRRFFGEGQRQQPRVTPSSGSGFIIDKQGHVLTNNHVVRDANEITVTLNDKRSFKATVVGADPETDVAVIQLQGASDLPVLPLGDSSNLRVGDWAIAIGNPLGQLRGSVTVGIISAQGRTDLNIFGGTPTYQDFIQTDASINFGNSGGPLCNIAGEAIGINTAINPSGQGIGFAIPINLAKHVAEQLVANGAVKRAMLGVYLAELTPEIAEGFGLSTRQGVVVQNVSEEGPAARAGLKRNDVIVEFDGWHVTDMQKFRLRVADTPAGKRVPLVVLRDGKRMSFDVTLTDRTEERVAATRPTPPANNESFLGIRVRELNADEKQSAGVESGVVITDIQDGSAAEEGGLRPGDVIEEVGGKPVSSAAAFARVARDAGNGKKHVVLLVNSGGQTRFVALRAGS